MRVMYVQYTNPAGYPPLQHSSRILAEKGWQVLFLGTGALGEGELELPPHPGILSKRLGFCPAGWRQKVHYALFTFWVLSWVLLWRPRWVYASDPFSCPVALLLSFLPGIRVLYHEHDSPNTDAWISRSKLERIVLATRQQMARRAKLCILPNEQRAKQFRRQTLAQQPVFTIWNCPACLETIGDRRTGDQFIIFYHGSIVPNRLPKTVLQALAKLPERMLLRVAGYETIGHRGYVESLRNYAKELGLAHRFDVLGPIPQRESLLEHCRNANVGLAFMPLRSDDVNERAMAGASNKPFDYLACGLALLVSNLKDWRKVFVEPGYGLACDPENPEDIARALQWFFENPAETHAMANQGRERVIAEWNYERQFEPVFAYMTQEAS